MDWRRSHSYYSRMDSMPFYDDDADCGDQCFMDQQDDDLDYDYGLEQENIFELYHHCIHPTINDTFLYLLPLIITASICNLAARIKWVSHNIFHSITASMGIYILWYYANECFYLFLFFTFAFYIFLQSVKELHKGKKVFLPSLALILYGEFYMESREWHKIRGVIMIAIMKASSIAIDYSESNDHINFYEYVGYMLNSMTLLFGPWTSFQNYIKLYRQTSWKIWWIFLVAIYLLIAFFFLCLSTCWTSWILSNNAGKWMLAYRDAFSFRTSHYFVSFTASATMLLGGYSYPQTLITMPWEIEVPRSLLQVVISWNIPMHTWLKTYIFRPGLKQLGKFGAVILTYLASSLLHGFNFQLAAVLLSLGFYTYIEHHLRHLLAVEFDACIASKSCTLHRCEHSRTPTNCYWVTIVNFLFGGLAVFHLAYLGLMFDTSETQETGYSYMHTIEKWSQLGFASHWVAFATYCAYYLIR